MKYIGAALISGLSLLFLWPALRSLKSGALEVYYLRDKNGFLKELTVRKNTAPIKYWTLFVFFSIFGLLILFIGIKRLA